MTRHWSYKTRLIAPVVATTYVILSSNEIQNVEMLVLTYPGLPGKWLVKQSEFFVLGNSFSALTLMGDLERHPAYKEILFKKS